MFENEKKICSLHSYCMDLVKKNEQKIKQIFKIWTKIHTDVFKINVTTFLWRYEMCLHYNLMPIDLVI